MTLVWRPGYTWWDPSLITTALWLDADDASTITASSGVVSQWNDRSGNLNHAAQATEVNRPTYELTGLNSKPALYFDRTNIQYLLTPTINNNTISSTYEITLAQVIKPAANWGTATNTTYSSAVGTRGSIGSYWSFIRNGTNSEIGFHADSQNWSGINLQSNSSIILDRVSSVNLLTERVNGTTVISTEVGQFSNTVNSAMYIGAGSAVTNIEAFKGHISEVILVTSALNDSTLQKIEGYLAHKWDLTANLPSNHPYKTNAPAP